MWISVYFHGSLKHGIFCDDIFEKEVKIYSDLSVKTGCWIVGAFPGLFRHRLVYESGILMESGVGGPG